MGFLVVRKLLGARAEPLFQRLGEFFSRWGRRIIILGMVLLGGLLVADAIGFFLGRPILKFWE